MLLAPSNSFTSSCLCAAVLLLFNCTIGMGQRYVKFLHYAAVEWTSQKAQLRHWLRRGS